MKKIQYLLKVMGVMIVVIAFSIGPLVPSAQAGLVGGGGLKVPSVSKIARELENRYHINLGSVQNQSEVFNVGSQKKSVPEVSLSFSPSDPRPGDKVTASALPSFFSNETDDLYFSWYLKRKGCDRDNTPSSDTRARCDNDKNGRIDVNDWKIEAMRILATNGFDNEDTTYESGDDTDNDGYKARFGGDNKVGTGSNYCALHNASTGTVYELVEGLADMNGICGSGLKPACIETSTGALITPGAVTGGFSGDVSGSSFAPTDGESAYDFIGHPQCTGGLAQCSSGSLRCVVNPENGSDLGSAPIRNTCKGTEGIPPSDCTHLFPKPKDFTSGDADFGVEEESFWRTDPKDNGTAQNGNKDEANVVGLGQADFTWSYDSGDEVGVAVEGTSMISTKHDDSSFYIMWGFSKNNCPISVATGVGSYTQSIRGYEVSFPAATLDMNDCLERNLVDPAEGGQPGRIDVSVTANPESVVNDESGDDTGDIVTASATVGNGVEETSAQVFNWTVSLANNIQFDNSGTGRRAKNVTSDLKEEELLGMTQGNGLTQIEIPFNMPKIWKSGLRLSEYVDANGIGYMRFSVNVSENFSSDVARKGKGDVIIKFQSTQDRLGAYSVTAGGDPLKLSLLSGSPDDEICRDTASHRAVCPVSKNEIIGLRLGSSGFTDYSWTVNGKPLTCMRSLSDQCSNDAATKVNFLPIFGIVGDVFTVSVTAVDVVSGKKATLSRVFRIVDPSVVIVSSERDQIWPKLLGQYRDVSGNIYDDQSLNIFQTVNGNTLRLKAVVLPSFLGNNAETQWMIDGEPILGNAAGEIELPVTKETGSIYNISYRVSALSSPAVRMALKQFWNISIFDSGEHVFSKSVQVEVIGAGDGTETIGLLPGSKKFAALASYIPASILFTVKAFFAMALILFISGFMMALAPNASAWRSRE